MFVLRITEKKAGPLTLDTIGEDIRLFTTKDKAEDWLVKNGFVFGRPDFYKMNANPIWFHQFSGRKLPLHEVVAEIMDISSDQDDEADYAYRLLKETME